MIALEERQLAHTRVVRARGLTMPPNGRPAAEILDSWVRSAERGLDLAQAAPVQVVEAAELARRREASGYLRRLALVEIETLSHQIAGSNFLLAFADHEGVILDLCADNRFATSSSGAGIQCGSRWSEDLCGTNGLGTALATGRPIAVNGPEHYFLELSEISCTAAPVYDAFGAIVGVLDASSYFESRQLHTQALVQMASSHIENRLLMYQMQGETLLAVHPRTEFLGTLSAGLLAFDARGRLRAANASAQRILSGLHLTPGTTFEELFAEPFEHVLGRLRSSDELRLRDALGSALAARCLGRPGSRAMPVRGSGRDSLDALLSAATPEPACAPVQRAQRGGARHDPGRDGHAETPTHSPLNSPVDSPVGTPPDATTDASSQAPSDPPSPDARVVQALALAGAGLRMGAHVLILGETGSGKEVLARQAHQASQRSGPFVAINCAALPDDLIEAELFGHAAGAYTGARREGHPGLIASADGGTLLLDEIRELPLASQGSLLRFLDDQIVRPVGGLQGRKVTVQILAATHADLRTEVSQGRFRADLYYRLSTVEVSLPPLRERDDFVSLVDQVLSGIAPEARLAPGAIDVLQMHDWPGNFRELRNLLTRAVLSAGGPRPLLQGAALARLLPAADHGGMSGRGSVDGPAAPRRPSAIRSDLDRLGAPISLQENTTRTVVAAFQHAGSSISRTARHLGVSRTTVYRHLRAAGLHVADNAPGRGAS